MFRCALAFTMIFASLAWAEPSGTDPLPAILDAIEAQQQAQREVDAWVREKEELLSKIRNLKNRSRYLHHRQTELESHSRRQEASILREEARQERLEGLQMQLEPYLEEVVRQLEQFVRSDLPFLLEERQNRLSFLQETLDDYRLPLSEKLRRVTEALLVEAEYGQYAEASESFIDLDGKKSKVFLLRLGRASLYYLTPDAQKAGRYDRAAGRWVELPGSAAVELKTAVQMVGKSRAMDLVNLSVGH